MLCPGGEALTTEKVRVSSGSAAVLGLLHLGLTDAPPTTAYLLLGGRCRFDCRFCAQARSSDSRTDLLSRVTWPEYDVEAVLRGLQSAYARRAILRCCLQVTGAAGAEELALSVVRLIHANCAVPLCVSIRTDRLAVVDSLLEGGAERVTLAVDAACGPAYDRVKGAGGFRSALDGLWRAAERFPGRIGTHIMVGLGETEQEAAQLLQACEDRGVGTALFAFTPIPGTAMAAEAQPSIDSYRRVLVARHLIVRHLARADEMRFVDGRLVAYGLPRSELALLLADGEAFRTSGCPDCNRPYYNERPTGPFYNYPRALRPAEAAEVVSRFLATIEDA